MMLVAALMVMLLVSALGAALILVTSSETTIAANFRNSLGALYAADAAAEQALAEVAAVADWDQLLNGSVRSDVCRRVTCRNTPGERNAGGPLADRRARELSQDDDLQRGRDGRRHSRTAVGREQSAVAAVRVR